MGVREGRPAPDLTLIKEITDHDALAAAAQAATTATGAAHIETDMRAHRNPRRMRAIKRAMIDLVRRARSRCPECARPGFGVTGHLAGLPCAWCASPTLLTRAEVWTCAGLRTPRGTPGHSGSSRSDALRGMQSLRTSAEPWKSAPPRNSPPEDRFGPPGKPFRKKNVEAGTAIRRQPLGNSAQRTTALGEGEPGDFDHHHANGTAFASQIARCREKPDGSDRHHEECPGDGVVQFQRKKRCHASITPRSPAAT